jgi:uncharacterized protein YcnI
LKTKFIAVTAALAISIAATTPASAHISVLPGVSATGSTTQALTAGQSGTLFFRVGHGCALDMDITNPVTGTSMEGSKWATSTFSVDIPVLAQGTGTTLPKPQWIPGWKSSVKKNATTGVYTVTWKASSKDFWIADGPEGDTGASQFADFGVSIKWAVTAAAQTVYFKSVQTCLVSVPGVKATKGKKAIAPRTIAIYNSWDVTDGTGADTVKDNTEHNTAPSVKVLG